MYKGQTLYPLTNAQKTVWLTDKLYPGTSQAVTGCSIIFDDSVQDYQLLTKTLNFLLKTNDSLRLEFLEENNIVKQYFTDYTEQIFETYDFSYPDGINSFTQLCNKRIVVPFKSLNDKLYELIICKLPNQQTGFFFKFNHMINDGWGVILFMEKLIKGYHQIIRKEDIEEQSFSYLQHIEDELAYSDSERYLKQKTFWKELFDTVPELTSLSNHTLTSLSANRQTFSLNQELTTQINRFCSNKGISPFSLFYSILSLVLWKITGKKDMVIATPILNRSGYQDKNTMGMFINTIPTRVVISPEMNFSEYIVQIFSNLKKCLKNQCYPLNEIIKEIRDKHKDFTKLFDVALSYQNAKVDCDTNFETTWNFSKAQFNALSVSISDRNNTGTFTIDYDYQTQVLTEAEVYDLHTSLYNLLHDALSNPEKELIKLSLLSESQRNYLLYDLNSTQTNYHKSLTVHELFERQALQTPDKIALAFENNRMTYRELNMKANQLAHFLKENGILKNDIIGLMATRSFDVIVGMLGILKAGGAYVPIDPTLPIERIQYMLNQSECRLLLTNLKNTDIGLRIPIISLDDASIYISDDFNPINTVTKDDLAYILFTSGSTGEPKGVMVHHQALNNLIQSTAKQMNLKNKTIVSITSISFDVFFLESLLPLAQEMTVVIANEEEQLVPGLFFKLIQKYNANIFIGIPSRLRLFLSDSLSFPDLGSITEIIIGGEVLTQTLYSELIKRTKAKIFNAYGPTETTVLVTLKEVTSVDDISLGKPISNTKIYILDDYLLPVPMGKTGEIYISGDCVSLGYIGKSEKTKERFIQNPFVLGEIMYRTGDLGKWISNGDVQYIGRNDNQVKIKGFRIEIEEIEKSLLRIPTIKEAVVLVKQNNFEKDYLCAYLTGVNICDAKIRTFLSQLLPSYMIPAKYIWLNSMPLTSNGKIDKKMLPEPNELALQDKRYVAPINSVELKLSKLWADALALKEVSVEDNLFSLGGDSLTILEIMTGALDFNWHLNAQDFYEYPTIQQLANKILGNIDEDFIQNNDIYNPKFKKSKLPYEIRFINTEDILLTGATGFLGVHLLNGLLHETKAKIYCLVRGDNAYERLEKTFQFYFPHYPQNLFRNRIFVIQGDITEPKLGLTDDEYLNLSQIVQTVIHSGAIVKHYGNYEDFRKTNVQSTINLISFCQKFNKSLNHISTISISGIPAKNEDPLTFTEDDFYIGQDYFSNVYIRSKFEAENHILKAMDNGLNARIFRVGVLTSRYQDGVFQQNISENAFYRKIKSIVATGVVSESFLKTKIEFTPVDYCSKAIIKLIQSNNENRVFHIFNHKFITGEDLLRELHTYGYSFKVLNDTDYLNTITKLSQEEKGKESLSGLVANLSLELESECKGTIVIDSTFTKQCLKKVGFNWCSINRKYLHKVIDDMIEKGFVLNP